jgi:hypothetical protein
MNWPMNPRKKLVAFVAFAKSSGFSEGDNPGKRSPSSSPWRLRQPKLTTFEIQNSI